MATSRPFAYLRDPLFLACVALYLLNRLVLKPYLPNAFSRDHLNDLICVPFCVPPMLWLTRATRLRAHDLPPQTAEVMIAIVTWSLAFEVVLPQVPYFRHHVTSDPADILCYILGAMLANTGWSICYAYRRPPGSEPPSPPEP